MRSSPSHRRASMWCHWPASTAQPRGPFPWPWGSRRCQRQRQRLGLVDGNDVTLFTRPMGATGDQAYRAAATSTATVRGRTDRYYLEHNYGFIANRAPVASADRRHLHGDPRPDDLSPDRRCGRLGPRLRDHAVNNGSVTMTGDGHTVYFRPATGSSGVRVSATGR